MRQVITCLPTPGRCEATTQLALMVDRKTTLCVQPAITQSVQRVATATERPAAMGYLLLAVEKVVSLAHVMLVVVAVTAILPPQQAMDPVPRT